MGEAAVIWGRLLGSFWLNVQLFALTLVFALPLGLIVAFGSMSRFAPLRGAVKTFVWIIRGTPLMLQIIVIYLGPGLMGWGTPWPAANTRACRRMDTTTCIRANRPMVWSELPVSGRI